MLSEGEGKKAAFRAHWGYIDKTVWTLTDPWELAKMGLGKAVAVPGVLDKKNVVSWLVYLFKQDFID